MTLDLLKAAESGLHRKLKHLLFFLHALKVWLSSQTEQHGLNPAVLYPWRQANGGLARVKRDWIIPPIRVLENSKMIPENLVQVSKSETPSEA